MKTPRFNSQTNQFLQQMAWAFILVSFFAITFFSTDTKASEKRKLTILSHSYFANEFDKRNINEHFLKVIKPALGDEFHLSVQFTNHARLIKRLSSKEPSCTFNAIKSAERAEHMLFSKVPTFMHMQRQLFGLKSNIDNLPSPVSVTSLLKEKYIFGIIGSSSYQQLDSYFEKYRSKIANIYGENPFLQLSKLLLNQRIDFIVAYPESLYAHLNEDQLKLVSSRPISEYPEFTNGYFTCSKTAEGIHAIRLMNTYMMTPPMAEYLYAIHKANNLSADLEAMLNVYKRRYKISFKNNS
ncbi:hypothetical protein NQS96_01040 [Pseudoalteromonas shioyasakiensis]|uniref:hypothetical protein n=1 Tax=Pseudoalteromonas shioyasakiensis TaxID=1190813 RepID=UPI0021181C80|nr:hypothetical protein [Pseudoalteromonas shioyasakiensis]MCQ8880383.1 hypothetical protein [Pseudoalteromonas shioyasakiensis]